MGPDLVNAECLDTVHAKLRHRYPAGTVNTERGRTNPTKGKNFGGTGSRWRNGGPNAAACGPEADYLELSKSIDQPIGLDSTPAIKKPATTTCSREIGALK
jgi:hypothetical protein